MNQAPARILIVDDHPVVRSGLTQLLEVEDDLRVCGEAGDHATGLQAAEQQQPDLAIVDVALGNSDGLDLVRQIHGRWPEIRVLVLSMLSERLYAEHALRAGAQGYVMKQEAPGTLLTAVRRVLGGGVHISDDLQTAWLERTIGHRTSPFEMPIQRLSDRELTVLRLIGQGLGTRQIATELHISVKTVETHRDRARHKLALKSSQDLVRYATLWLEREATGQDG